MDAEDLQECLAEVNTHMRNMNQEELKEFVCTSGQPVLEEKGVKDDKRQELIRDVQEGNYEDMVSKVADILDEDLETNRSKQ